MQVERLDESRSELEEELDGARAEAAKVAAARAAEAAAVTKAEGLEVELGTLQEQFKARVNGGLLSAQWVSKRVRETAFSSMCGGEQRAQALEVDKWQKRSETQQTEASTAAESAQRRTDAQTKELTDAKHGLGFLESECNALRGRVGELQAHASELQHKVTARVPGGLREAFCFVLMFVLADAELVFVLADARHLQHADVEHVSNHWYVDIETPVID